MGTFLFFAQAKNRNVPIFSVACAPMKAQSELTGFVSPATPTVAWIAATVLVGYALGAAVRYGLSPRPSHGAPGGTGRPTAHTTGTAAG
jgi:hypothetical protein